MHYFYLWKNHLGRTCYGITGNPENRRRKYEGHCGYPVKFDHLFEGPQALIEDLEDQVKSEFWEHMFGTEIGKYEWIREDIPNEQVVGYVKWEVENTYNNNIVTKVEETS